MREMLVGSNLKKNFFHAYLPFTNEYKGKFGFKIHDNIISMVQEQKKLKEEQLFSKQPKETQIEIMDVACQPICPICNFRLKRVRYDFLGGNVNYFMGYMAYCPGCRKPMGVESEKPLGFYSAGTLKSFNKKYLKFKVLLEKEVIKLKHNISKGVLRFYNELNDIVEIIVIDDRVVSIR